MLEFIINRLVFVKNLAFASYVRMFTAFEFMCQMTIFGLYPYVLGVAKNCQILVVGYSIKRQVVSLLVT